MTQPTLDDTPLARDDVVLRPLSDEWVIYDPESNQIHVLNKSAAVAWLCCTGDLSVREIVDEVASSFTVEDPARMEGEILEAVSSFARLGLFA